MRRVSQRIFLLISDALLGGSAGFRLQDLYLSFKEADQLDLEAKWRHVYNRVVRRDRSTPRAEIYATPSVPGLPSPLRHRRSQGIVLCDVR